MYFPWFLVTAVFCLTFQVLGAFWSIIGPWSMHGRLGAQQRLDLGPFHTSCGLTGPSCGLQEVPTCDPSGPTSPGHNKLPPAGRRPNMEMPAVQNRLQAYKREVSHRLRDLLSDLWTLPSTWETREGPGGLFGLGSSRNWRETRAPRPPARQIRGSRVVSVLLLMNSLFYLFSCCMNMSRE